MFRFRFLLPLLMTTLTAIMVSSVLAAPKKSPFSVNKGDEIPKDAISYASDQKIELDTAIYRLALSNLAGNLDAALSGNEEDTYAGLWIQHSPQFRIIVQFTRGGRETIRPYIENGPLADIVEIREVKYTLKELKAAQVEAKSKIRSLGVRTNSGTNVFENRFEVYVVERSRFDVAMQNVRIELPPQVKVVTVSELGSPETDIYAGLELSECTSGFSVVNSSGVKGILTAAHCNNTISYNGVNLPFQGSAFGGSYDVQWHTAPGFEVRNLAFDGTNNRYIFSAKHRDNQALNDYVCKYGRTTHYTCGYIVQKDYDPDPNAPPMNNTLIRVHHDGVNLSETGDSGGPWFQYNTAYGLHVGGIGDDAYYMAINYIDFLGLSVLTNNVNLPIVMNEQTQSRELIDPAYINPYPSPNDEDISNNPPSSPEPNPYPNPYP
jgi:hypothetical protein